MSKQSDHDPAAPEALDATLPKVAVDGDGTALYRDARSGLSLAVPGRPRFAPQGPDLDALAILGDVAVEVRIALVAASSEAPLLEQVAALAGDVCGEEPM